MKLLLFLRLKLGYGRETLSDRISFLDKSFFNNGRESSHAAGNAQRHKCKLSVKGSFKVAGNKLIIDVSGDPGCHVFC